jgi:Xaa-Pro aminopeptidase
MAWGTMAVDWETRVDYDRLRAYRLKRAQEQLEKKKIGSFLCFDWYNIRYITAITLGEWGRDKRNRYCLLPRGQAPTLFEGGTSAVARKRYSPWIADHIKHPQCGWTRAEPEIRQEMSGNMAKTIRDMLADYGLEKEPLGLDLTDVYLIDALRKQGLEVVDACNPMLDARLIKNQDEIQLLKAAAAMVDAAYDTLVRAIRPGVKENELAGLAAETLWRLGSEDVEAMNSISGSRTYPHPHLTSDRIIRPNEFVFFDLMHAFNGYRTCYYRSFFCGRPTAAQKEAYHNSYTWLYNAIKAVKPGATTADIASQYPTCEAWGYKTEQEASGMATGHGIGLSIHEKPTVNRVDSLAHPFPIQEGMVFALETYANTPDFKHGCRIEEECVVTADGCEIITKYPCEELICVGVPKYW